MPERHDPWARRFLRLQGDETERVIGKVHRDVEPDDDAAGGAESRESGRRNQGKVEGRKTKVENVTGEGAEKTSNPPSREMSYGAASAQRPTSNAQCSMFNVQCSTA